MSLFSSLEKLIGISHPLQTAPMQPVQHPQSQPFQHPPQSSQTPDITYNPNPNTNIPYSSHNQALIQLLAQGFRRPGLQMPSNLPIGGFQIAQNPQNLGGQLGFNNSDFRDSYIGY